MLELTARAVRHLEDAADDGGRRRGEAAEDDGDVRQRGRARRRSVDALDGADVVRPARVDERAAHAPLARRAARRERRAAAEVDPAGTARVAVAVPGIPVELAGGLRGVLVVFDGVVRA